MAAAACCFVRPKLSRAFFASAVIGVLGVCSACSNGDAAGNATPRHDGAEGGFTNSATSASERQGPPGGGAAIASPSGASTSGGGGATNANGSNLGSGASGSGGHSGSTSNHGGGASGSRSGIAGASTSAGDIDAGTEGAGGSTSAVDAGAHTPCKRGIATNTAPGAAFFPAISWWYNWSMGASGTDVGIEFVPMMWGKADVTKALPAGSKYLLTFNEPNFQAQSNLTPQQAASYWPMIETKAKAAHVPIVGPAMNFCGPAANCNGTSPYQYLKDFFAACSGCEVDYIAVHWYNCDLPSLKDYLEPGGNLEGFEQFGKPIWLTEFSCDGSASVAQQEAFMRAAIPYLESNPHVFRYSWFSAGPIRNAELMNADGSPNALGKVYAGLPQTCR